MKTIIITTLIYLPCLAAFSEGETLIPNFFGIAYMIGLHFASKTERGKKFLRKLYRETYTESDTRMK